MAGEVVVVAVCVAALLLTLAVPDRPALKCPPDCHLGAGWHVHFPEGRTHMTPAQWEASRESIRKARREVPDG